MISIVRRPDAPKGYTNIGLILLKAYNLGDRILASAFRRQVNNNLIGRRLNFGAPSRRLLMITYAFANIPNDRNILQFLVNKFCNNYDPVDDEDEEEDDMSNLPPAFLVRVTKRLAYVRNGVAENGCYVEHATDGEQKSCKQRHLKFCGGENGYGYFGEPSCREE
jgi:hypothetical protein